MQCFFCFILQTTNAEEYFDVHASAVATSDRTLSRLDLPQMDVEALRETIKKSGATHMKQCRMLCGQHEQLFRRWMFYMWLVVFSWGFVLLNIFSFFWQYLLLAPSVRCGPQKVWEGVRVCVFGRNKRSVHYFGMSLYQFILCYASACMHMYMHGHTHSCTHTNTHAHTHALTNTHRGTQTQIHVHAHTHTHTHSYTLTHTHTFSYHSRTAN